MSIEQIVAIIIFVAMFILIITEVLPKHVTTLGAGALVMIIVFGIIMRSGSAAWHTLNIAKIFTPDFWYSVGESESQGIDWATIMFLGGMMVMVEGMAKAGFFRWLCMWLAKLVNYKPVSLFVAFMILSAVLAMFIDSITVILFLAAVTIELSKLLKFNPVPMIMSEIFCANLGGSATMCGDPPNIIIGSQLGYSFMDFVRNTGLIALVALVAIVIYFYIIFHKQMVSSEAINIASLPDPREEIKSKRDFIASICIFVFAIALLVSHSATHLTVAFIGCVVAVLTLVVFYKYAAELLSKVDYHTLLFFVGLFIVVGGLEQTGVLELIAGLIGRICGDNQYAMVAIILWVSAIASALVDNIPFAATMVPIIRTLAATTGIPIETLAWSLAMGTDVGGSATPIGASANVVGISVAAKNGHLITWGKYCKSMVPAMLLVSLIAMIMIFVRYC